MNDRERHKAWVSAHPENVRASRKKWRDKQDQEELKAYNRAANMKSRKKNPKASRAAVRNSFLKSTYGIDEKEYQRLLALQNGACAICKERCSTWSRLSVDHDHNTGRVRGLLCNQCNRAIGLLRDNPRLLMLAAEYLSPVRRLVG